MRALDPAEAIALGRIAVVGGIAQLLTQASKFCWLARSDQFELRGSALLLSGRFRRAFLLRLAILVATIVLALSSGLVVPALPIALGGELLGRWLFFVSVVPKNTAASFTGLGRAA